MISRRRLQPQLPHPRTAPSPRHSREQGSRAGRLHLAQTSRGAPCTSRPVGWGSARVGHQCVEAPKGGMVRQDRLEGETCKASISLAAATAAAAAAAAEIFIQCAWATRLLVLVRVLGVIAFCQGDPPGCKSTFSLMHAQAFSSARVGGADPNIRDQPLDCQGCRISEGRDRDVVILDSTE